MAKGDVEKAIEHIQKETEINPFLSEPYTLLGQVYLKQEKLQEAKKSFRTAYKKNLQSPEAIYGLGYTSFLLKQYEEALELLQKGTRIAPGESKMQLMLGYTYEKMGQRKLAEESFKNYLKLNPDATNKKEIQAKILELK